MPSEPTPDARAISETSSMIQAMRTEGERRVAAFRERMAVATPHPTWDGYPPNRQDGAHWLREKRQWDTAAVPGPTFLAEWSELSDRWFYFGVSGSEDAAEIARRCDYLGRVSSL